MFWLEGVLATAKGIKPSADEIASRLGAGSSAYALDRATLSALYVAHKHLPTLKMKRLLWSKLLTSALGTQFEDTDDLFIEHTLLVNSAEIIAHAVLGLPIENLNPASLLSGAKFDESGIYGVVEADFFDWVTEIEGGEKFISALARRLGRFDWSAVEQDVLKVLYESVIGAETRKRLGEYYTPDWLAEVMVNEVITAPLEARVLDTACGSGTFLFHAIRKYIEAAEATGRPLPDMLQGITQHVIGMDLHPVAVTLARVTYLLAIGRDRLTDPSRRTIQVPVYLGDSIQWQEQQIDLWTAGNLVIHADDKKELFAAELRFPDALLEDASIFDQLVNELATRASKRKPKAPMPSLTAVFKRLSIAKEHHATIEGTFKTMCRLHDEGRDHIWAYYIRNLARPLWLSRPQNRVDILIGNPPWLAYRHMTKEMQNVFRKMSEARGLWAGSEVATHQDLSALFAARASELYLKKGGRLALVMPNAAVDRYQYEGFRTGNYQDKAGAVMAQVAFSGSWDLRRIRPHFFPRGASVVFGARAENPKKMTTEVEVWTGRLPSINAPWSIAEGVLSRTTQTIKIVNRKLESDYEPAFTQGATLSPHFMFVVAPKDSSPLGLPAGKMAIQSSRSAYEKTPWKEMSSLEGVVESEFVRPLVTGETLLPYRLRQRITVLIPSSASALLTTEELDLYPGLASWWSQAEEIWLANRSSDRLSLTEQLDYQSKLSKQLPIPPLRVIYNASGMHLCAAKLKDRRAIISKSLYWAPVANEQEADYICAILNSSATTEMARPFMSYGKDERHFDKHIWQLPIPQYDPSNKNHVRLVKLAKDVAALCLEFAVDEQLHFPATRRRMRELIDHSEAGAEINELTFELLS
ncbi:MAG: N-6 DNA methylase [Hyphomicrobiaceae bacterium]